MGQEENLKMPISPIFCTMRNGGFSLFVISLFLNLSIAQDIQQVPSGRVVPHVSSLQRNHRAEFDLGFISGHETD